MSDPSADAYHDSGQGLWGQVATQGRLSPSDAIRKRAVRSTSVGSSHRGGETTTIGRSPAAGSGGTAGTTSITRGSRHRPDHSSPSRSSGKAQHSSSSVPLYSSDHDPSEPYASGSFLSLDDPETPRSSSSLGHQQQHSDLEEQDEEDEEEDDEGEDEDDDEQELDPWSDTSQQYRHPYATSSVFSSSDRRQRSRGESSSSTSFFSSQNTRKARELREMASFTGAGGEPSETPKGGRIGAEHAETSPNTSPPDLGRHRNTRGNRLGQQMARQSSNSVLAATTAATTTATGGLGLQLGRDGATRPLFAKEDAVSSQPMLRVASDRPTPSLDSSGSRTQADFHGPHEWGQERLRGVSDSRTVTLRSIQMDQRPVSAEVPGEATTSQEVATHRVSTGARPIKDTSTSSPSTLSATKSGRLSRLYYNPPDQPSVSGPSLAAEKGGSTASILSEPHTRRLAFGYRTPSHPVSTTASTSKGVAEEPKRSASALGQYDYVLDREVRSGLSSPKAGTPATRELILPSINGGKLPTLRRDGPGEGALLQQGAEHAQASSKGMEGAAQSHSGAFRAQNPLVIRTRTSHANTVPLASAAGVKIDVNAGKSHTIDAGTFTSPRPAPPPMIAKPAAGDPANSASPHKSAILTDEQIVKLGAVEGQSPRDLLPADGSPLSSKNVLTIALAKAQSAVTFDSNNGVPEAVEAYGQAVRLLQEVMYRITPKPGSNKKSSREDERRRLKVIHDTYTERIRLLAMLYESSEGDDESGANRTMEETMEEVRSQSSDNPDQGRQLPDQIRQAARTSMELKQIDKASATTAPLSLRRPMNDRERPMVAYATSSPSHLLVKNAQSQPPTPLSSDHQEVLADTSQDGMSQGHTPSETTSSYRSITSGGPSTGLMPRSNSNQNKSRDLWLPNSALVRQEYGEETLLTPATPYFDATEPGQIGGPLPRSPLVGVSDQATEGNVSEVDGERFKTRQTPDEPLPVRRTSSSLDAPMLQPIVIPRLDTSPPHLEKDERSRGTTLWPSSASNTLMPDSVDGQRSHSYDSGVSTTSSRRRAATLATPASRAAAKEAVNQTLLVNPTTNDGTISQRRKSPTIPAMFSSEEKDATLDSDQSASDSLALSTAALNAQFVALRKRALSQPGNPRPVLNGVSSFQDSSTAKPPPMPKLKSKRSLPGLAILTAAGQSGLPLPNGDGSMALGQLRPNFRMPSPALSSSSGYHALLDPGASISPSFSGVQADPYWASSYPGPSGPGQAAELFPSGLASLQALGSASYNLSHTAACPRLRVAAPALVQEFFDPFPPQAHIAVLRPYGSVKALNTSIARGGFVTSKICVPSSIWVTPGVRLTSLETKIRLIEIVTNGIDAVEKSGSYLLNRPRGGRQPGLSAVQAAAFAKQLEDFEVLLGEVQNTLAKKLGVNEFVSGSTGKKGGNSFGAFSSKFTRSLDRIAQQTSSGKNFDSPGAYVDSLQRLFSRSRVLEAHLTALLRSKSSASSSTTVVDADTVEAYAALPPEVHRLVDAKLHRASDFFAQVIVKIVAKDLQVLVDKSLKRASSVLVD